MDDIGTMSGGQIAQNGAIRFGDKLAAAWFKCEPKLMVAESDIAGHQVWKNVDIVYVQQPGDMQPVRREIGSMEARARWPEQWAAYQEGRKQAPDGTPLAVIFGSDPAIPKSLESAGIHTVEQLAGAADSSLHNFPFGGTLKQKAAKYLLTLSGAEGFNKVQSELDREKEKTRSLEMRLTEMEQRYAAIKPESPAITMEQVMTLMASLQPEKRGPGRPPKTEN